MQYIVIHCLQIQEFLFHDERELELQLHHEDGKKKGVTLWTFVTLYSEAKRFSDQSMKELLLCEDTDA